MKILLTGANGYIGTRLLPPLLEAGHEVVAVVRSARRLDIPEHLADQVQILKADLLKKETLHFPKDIDAAYYLVHSMTHKASGFADMEEQAARNFVGAVERTRCQQMVYLSGLISDTELSEHLASRQNVEDILRSSSVPTTVLRAGIIIGAGSASFEIIRDLVEKLPVMIAPRWVSNLCQPIGVVDVLGYLRDVLGRKEAMNRVFDIGGPEPLTYKQMLYILAEERGLKRYILSVPVLTPRLSSYWLYFVTSTNFTLAKALVHSLRNNAVCTDYSIQKVLPRNCMTFREAIRRAFVKIEQNAVLSSWKDAMVHSELNPDLMEYVQVPEYGCLKDVTRVKIRSDRESVLQRLWGIGGNSGWYVWDWAWILRGYLDKLVGGVGLRRGRTHPDRLKAGDALDFWRVLLADREQGHLLLYAEMRLPGEAWLEWKVKGDELIQTATFRPKGLLGRLYWYSLLPAHHFIFSGMANAIAK